jgi:hypothetical protein
MQTKRDVRCETRNPQLTFMNSNWKTHLPMRTLFFCMLRTYLRVVLALTFGVAASTTLSTPSRAQTVERQIAFDSAGRVMEITPSLAARIGLTLPVWRITGDYTAARLFTSSDTSYVIIVTRRDGTLERYPISGADVDQLRSMVAGFAGTPTTPGRAARNAFVRNQVLLGLLVYGPTAALAATDDGAVQTGTYLLVAGASFLAASQLAGEIKSPQVRLSTHAALHGAAGGGALTYALNGEGRGIWAGAFFGSVLGTAAGVYLGRGLTDSEAAASGFGADVAVVTTLGVIGMINGEHSPQRVSPRTRAGLLVAAGLVGYPIGVLYPRNANYNVTPGDVSVLWLTGALGALGASTLIANGEPSTGTVSAALTGGFILGTMAGDRFIVQNVDHSEGDITILGLGTIAGALMGGGIYILSDRDADHPALGTAVATVGGIVGLVVAENLTTPADDRGHQPRVSFNPANLLLSSVLKSGKRNSVVVAPFLTVRF